MDVTGAYMIVEQADKMQPHKISWKVTVATVVGAVIAVSGAVMAIFWDDIFYAILAKELKLSNTSRAYPVWKEPNIPLHLDFYFFNWTNPEVFLNNTKPNLVEMGPYRFRERKQKINITWHPENNTVSYRQIRHWYFDAEGSKGSLDDNVTTLNVVAASAVYTSRNWSYLRQKGVSVGLVMFQQKLEVRKPVRQLLFEGYQDGLLDLANSLPQAASGAPPVDKFGWFYKRNGSSEMDGLMNLATGEDDIANLGRVANWNYANFTPFYPGHCGMVNGSAGEFYPPKVMMEDTLTMFSPDLCRSISFDFDKVVEIDGVTGYQYSGGDRIMDNGTLYPENACFCLGECQPSGVLNVSSCRYGSPAFISFPHFYQADPSYRHAVTGMRPDKEKHNFYLTLEPTSGVPIDVAARMQLNILVAPNPNINLYMNVPKIYFPVLWFEQHVTLSGSLTGSLRRLAAAPVWGGAFSLAVIALGLLVLLWHPVAINVRACVAGTRARASSDHVPQLEIQARPSLNNSTHSIKSANLACINETGHIDEKLTVTNKWKSEPKVDGCETNVRVEADNETQNSKIKDGKNL